MQLMRFWRSSVGKKIVVAVTGLFMIGFLVMHAWVNLHVYEGDTKINEYALWLRTFAEQLFGFGGFLWVMRVGLLAALVLHVLAIVALVRQNRAARPARYRRTNYRRRIIVSLTMALSGSAILVFVVLHILQFTTGTWQPTEFHVGEDGMPLVYTNLHDAFQVTWIAWLYIAAVGLVSVHIYHGAWSVMQTLGLNNQDRNIAARVAATVLALGIFLTFASVPVLFWTGALGPAAASDGTHATGLEHTQMPVVAQGKDD